jgi:hypothetical protein
MILGIVLIVLGLVFFARALGFIDTLSLNMAWPLLLVILGISLLSHKVLGHECTGKNCWCGGTIDWTGKKGKKR